MSIKMMYNAEGNITHVMMTHAEYIELRDGKHAAKGTLLFDAGTKITLDQAHVGDYLDIVKFVYFWFAYDVRVMPINQRITKFVDFRADEFFTVEYQLRDMFLGNDSSYINTMMANKRVIDALVKTGLFERTRAKTATVNNRLDREVPRVWGRSIMALEINISKAKYFLARHGYAPVVAKDSIDLSHNAQWPRKLSA